MKLRHLVFFVVLILLGVFVVRSLGRLDQLIDLLRHVNLWILLLILPVRYGYYWSNTRYYQHFFKLFKYRRTYNELFNSVMAMNFVNTVLPSAGISGATYFSHSLESSITQKESYLAQFFWYIAVFLSIVLTLGLSFIVLFFSNSITQPSFRIILVVMSILLLVAVIILALTLNEKIFQKILFIITRPINWILKLFKRPPLGEKQIDQFVDGFHDLVELFTDKPRRMIQPFIDAWLTIVFEVLSIMIVFLAFGSFVNPGVIGAAYIFALLLSAVSVLTSGVGVYEATMVGVFVGLGVPFDLAFSVTAIYRIAALWLFIPIGFYFYQRQTLNSGQDKKA